MADKMAVLVLVGDTDRGALGLPVRETSAEGVMDAETSRGDSVSTRVKLCVLVLVGLSECDGV